MEATTKRLGNLTLEPKEFTDIEDVQLAIVNGLKATNLQFIDDSVRIEDARRSHVNVYMKVCETEFNRANLLPAINKAIADAIETIDRIKTWHSEHKSIFISDESFWFKREISTGFYHGVHVFIVHTSDCANPSFHKK